MKGSIVCCLKDLVFDKFGEEKWQQSLEDAGLAKNQPFLSLQDIDDTTVMQVIRSVCKVTGLSPSQAADAFGDYWVNVYSQKLYSVFYKKHKDAKSFLSAMDDLHIQVTKTIDNSKPPRFEFQWKGEDVLIMHYKSSRGMIDFLVGLINGVGKYYNENLRVTKLSANQVQVVFV